MCRTRSRLNLCRILLYYIDRAIGRAAVNDDVLDIYALLRKDALNRCTYCSRTVITRCYKRYLHSQILSIAFFSNSTLSASVPSRYPFRQTNRPPYEFPSSHAGAPSVVMTLFPRSRASATTRPKFSESVGSTRTSHHCHTRSSSSPCASETIRNSTLGRPATAYSRYSMPFKGCLRPRYSKCTGLEMYWIGNDKMGLV